MGIQKFIESICVQTAVLWSFQQEDGFGNSTFAEPVEIQVRWEEKHELLTDEEGKQFVSRAEIILPIDIKRLDYLYLGTLVEISSESDPKQVEGAHEVKTFTKVPMIKSTTVFVRKAYL